MQEHYILWISLPLLQNFWVRLVTAITLHGFMNRRRSETITFFFRSITFLASYADGLGACHAFLPTWGGTRDKPKNVCLGGYHFAYRLTIFFEKRNYLNC